MRRLQDQLVDLAQCLDAGRTPSSALTQVINGILGGLEGTETTDSGGRSLAAPLPCNAPPTPIRGDRRLGCFHAGEPAGSCPHAARHRLRAVFHRPHSPTGSPLVQPGALRSPRAG